eukprot:Colp12_sorted_trinity150504_noHs@15196
MAGRVSTAKGNNAKKGQKYQNTFAYKHNKNSKKTEVILNMPIDGLCARCKDIIEWRKKFRKYKPLSVAKKCVSCDQKAITKAYHEICDPCAVKQGVCAKCRQSKDIIPCETKSAAEKLAEENDLKNFLAKLSERQRRSYLRKMERGEEPPIYKLKEGRDDFDDDDFDLSDEEGGEDDKEEEEEDEDDAEEGEEDNE